MILPYKYQGKHACIVANWSDDGGSSCIYRDVIQKLADAHGDAFERYFHIAAEADSMADKLYRLIYEYTNEYCALPYNPRNRKLFIRAFSNICDVMGSSIRAVRSEEESVVALLFLSVLDKFLDITGLYLLDNAYHRKHWKRRATKEVWLENTAEIRMSYQFENILFQTTEMNRAFKLLTAKERRRFYGHWVLGLTFQEIADAEGVKKQTVEESASTAFKKIRECFEC